MSSYFPLSFRKHFRLPDFRTSIGNVESNLSDGRPLRPKTPLVEVSYRSIFGIAKVNKAERLAAERAEKAAAEYKQCLEDKENQIRVLTSRLAKVKDETIAQVASINTALEQEKTAHGVARAEILQSRAYGERILAAHNSIQSEYISRSSALQTAHRDLEVKKQKGADLQKELDCALQVVRQLKESIVAIETDKSELGAEVSRANVGIEALHRSLADLEGTQLRTASELQSAKEDFVTEQLQREAKVHQLSLSLSAAQDDLASTRKALKAAETQARYVQAALHVEHTKRVQNMEAFKTERARLMRSMSAAHVHIDGLKRALQAAEKKVVKELAYGAEFQTSLHLAEAKNEELTLSFTRKEKILFRAINYAKQQFDEQREAKEAALAEIEDLKAALAAKEGNYQQVCKVAAQLMEEKITLSSKLDDANRELAQVCAPGQDTGITQPTQSTEDDRTEGIEPQTEDEDVESLQVIASDESDKENCEVAALSQWVEDSSPIKDGFSDSKEKGTEGSEAVDQSLPTLPTQPFGLATTNVHDSPFRGPYNPLKATEEGDDPCVSGDACSSDANPPAGPSSPRFDITSLLSGSESKKMFLSTIFTPNNVVMESPMGQFEDPIGLGEPYLSSYAPPPSLY